VELTADGTGGLTGQLPPPSAGAWSLQAVDLPGTPSFELDSLTVDGAQADIALWWVARPMQDDGGFGDPLQATAAGLGYAGAVPRAAGESNDGLFHPSTTGGVRMVPSLDGSVDDAAAAPVVVSAALADEFRLSIGDTLPIELEEFDGTVLVVTAGIAPAIPGSLDDAAMLIDLQRLNALRLRSAVELPNPARAWVSTSDATATVAAMRDVLPVGTRFESVELDQSRNILGSAVIALWAAAAGGVALAILAVGAVAGAQLRGRRDEVVVLRAVGVESGRQGAVRRLELLAVLAYGLLAGVLAGLASSLLTASALARAAVPRPYASLATTAMLDPLLLAGGLGLLVAVLLVVAVVYGGRVAEQARTLSAREVLL
jgi:hypothetical protein